MKILKNLIAILVSGYVVGVVITGNPTFYEVLTERHYHDGLYISRNQFLGVSDAWIIEGDELKVISQAGISVVECSQSRFEIEVYSNKGTQIFRTDNEGNFMIGKVSNRLMEIDERMMWVNGRTDYTYQEVLTLLDTTYSN